LSRLLVLVGSRSPLKRTRSVREKSGTGGRVSPPYSSDWVTKPGVDTWQTFVEG
jgi:hypothetical protein